MMKTTFLIIVVSFVVVAESSTIPPLTLPSGCMFEGQWYPEGDFQLGPCRPCRCYRGHAACAVVDCFYTPCVDPANDPNHCCPICPNGPNCGGPNGEKIPAGQVLQVDEHVFCRCPDTPWSFPGAICNMSAPAEAQIP